MAKTEQTKWVKAEAAVEQVDTGDILNPLRRVQAQYAAKAASFEHRAPKEDTRKERVYSRRPLPKQPNDASYYHTAAVNVGRLLGDSLALELRG